jgi:monovalent cation:H+ antiporter-2, CPA2 family
VVTAKGGADVATTSAFLMSVIGSMTIITTFLSPYLIELGWKVTKSATPEQRERRKRTDSRSDEQ